MIGVQDFIGYYDWTFEYLRQNHGGDTAVEEYWAQTIAFNSQAHTAKLIQEKGLRGMAEYWGHTLVSEEAGFSTELGDDHFRIDMYDCPSKGFLIKTGRKSTMITVRALHRVDPADHGPRRVRGRPRAQRPRPVLVVDAQEVTQYYILLL